MASKLVSKSRGVVLGLLVAAGSTVALTAWAHGGGMMGGGGHMMGGGGHMMGGDGHMMGNDGHMMGGGPGMMMGGPGGGRMLDAIGASDAQRAQIRQIWQVAGTELAALREQHRALRDRALQAFSAPNVDANVVEQVRREMLALHDRTSQRVSAAMVESSRVLTPEQRAKLAERIQERGDRMHERHERMQRQPGQEGRPAQPRG